MPEATPVDLPEDVVALVPMRDVVLFPHVMVPVSVGRAKSVAALLHAVESGRPLGIVLQKDSHADEPGRAELCDVGTLAQVVKHVPGEGVQHAIVHGLSRFRLVSLVEGHPFLAARIERLPEDATPPDTQTEALALQLRERAAEILGLLPGVPAEAAHMMQAARAPQEFADIVASLVDSDPAEKQALLESAVLADRLRSLLSLVARRIQVLRLSQEIGERTRQQLDDRQRRFLLKEQLRTIQQELGEDGESSAELERLQKLVADAGMPPEVDERARRELARLQRLQDSPGEAAVLRTWLEWMTELPWRTPAPLEIDIERARQELSRQHFGLEPVKRRILEFLAVRKLNPSAPAPILCFVGPPGVGKTSLGQCIARTLQRPFVRVSLGGVHDEAEVRGHRRTYVGALPGNIVQALRKAGTLDPVLMLDEMDKLSASAHGDPSAALLEVLDPEQNASFRDNYLGVPVDLSRVTFLCTANVLEQMPAPVRDRVEVIELPGYSLEEKERIARTHLLPRQLAAHGLQAAAFELDDAALRRLASDYTREAGVRQLDRCIGSVARHAAMAVVESPGTRVRVTERDLAAIHGPAPFEHEAALRRSVAGIATGLAWTPAGGDILFVEAARMPGDGQLILTGQLGDVMKESARAALTLVRSRAAGLDVAPDAFAKADIHVHVPAGAVPKDGPSAGVAMFAALASVFTGRPVRAQVAMTGEISLRGLVLPIGGVREKVLAAQRAGVATVLLPRRNEKDLADMPPDTRAGLRVVLVDSVDDVLREGLE
ncbi:MAG: endopeptidase La [Burkholderiaceae bacterium]